MIANDSVGGRDLLEVLRSHGVDAGSADIRMVAPALRSRVRFWSSDIDRARRAAEARLRRSLVGLDDEGGHVEGLVGDCEALLAIADELREFDADEIILVTHPAEEATGSRTDSSSERASASRRSASSTSWPARAVSIRPRPDPSSARA